MSRPLTVAEVQAALDQVVDDAARGEVIPITRQGKIIAEIGPPAGRSRLGRMAGSVRFTGDIVEPIDVAWGEDG